MPVTNPTVSDVHLSQPLTNFAQKYLQDSNAFIAGRAMPVIPVIKQFDQYYTFDRGDFFRDEAEERADGGPSAGGGFSLSNDNYMAKVYAYHKDVTDRQRANADSQVKLEQSSTEFVTLKMMIRRERLFENTYMTPANWTTSANVSWVTTADPVDDVTDAKTVVHQLTGFRPNKGIATRSAWDTLLKNDALLSRISGGSNNNMPAKMLKSLIEGWFELDEIFIMDGVYNTAVRGATASNSFMGGDNFLLYYAPDTAVGDTPTAGAGFAWTGFNGATPSGIAISKFRRPQEFKSDRVEGEIAIDYKLTGADLGYMFTTPST